MLKIYNTLTRKKEKFKISKKNKIKMYVCGVTTYDLCHIGHARTFIVFDMINRYLRYIGYKITYIRNITDIDDKIIKKSIENKEKYNKLSSRMLIEMHKDFDNLNILRPDIEPKVTDHIVEIINLVKKLIKMNQAYISKNGDVIYSINKNKEYGSLSKQNIKKLKKNKKNEKKNKLDFVLWKMAKKNEPSWKSPWGKGRPGWHTECSAINKKYFSKKCDIHGGGIDLIFPHHENEMAQFNSIYNKKYVKFWIHSGIIKINKKKMSKSMNNFISIKDTLKKFDAETIRFFLLSKKYRKNLTYSEEKLKKSKLSLKKLYTALKNFKNEKIKNKKNTTFQKKFIKAMNDDFNTPKACSILFKLAKKINKLKNKNIKMAYYFAIELKKLANTLGILFMDPEKFLKNNIKNEKIEKIEKLIKKRNKARKNKQWNKADLIRQKIFKMGIILEDNKKKTTWRSEFKK